MARRGWALVALAIAQLSLVRRLLDVVYTPAATAVLPVVLLRQLEESLAALRTAWESTMQQTQLDSLMQAQLTARAAHQPSPRISVRPACTGKLGP